MPTLAALVYTGHRKIFRLLWLLGLTSLLALALCGCSNTGATAAKTDAAAGRRRQGEGRSRPRGRCPRDGGQRFHRDVPVEIQVIGNVEAYSTITVKAQVGGQLVGVNFKEGDFVKKGEKLFDIDPRPLEAAYNQVVANLGATRPPLLQAQANMAREPTPSTRTRRPSATPSCSRPA